MSDKTVFTDNSMSDNATTVERKCLTDYRDPSECPTKQQVGNSVYDGDQRNKLERALGVRSTGRFRVSQPCSTMPFPYPMDNFGFVELIIKVFEANPLTQNHKRHGIETVLAANYLLGKTDCGGPI